MKLLNALLSVALVSALAGLAGCGSEAGAKGEDPPVWEREGHLDVNAEEDAPRYTTRLEAIPVIEAILPRTEYVTIDPEVSVEGYYYDFTLHYGEQAFEVLSVRKMLKQLRELEVLHRYETSEHGSPVLAGLGQSVKGVGVGFVNIFRHPGQSIKRVGQGIGRLGRAAGNIGDETPTQASDGSDRALSGKGPAGGERRLLAWELGLDVYTDNPAVQEMLNQVARKRLAGKLPVNAGVFALPGGLLFTLSLTPMGYDPSTEELIRDKGPTELRHELAQRYEQQFGLVYETDPGITALLNNPNFSPREQAYLWRYLTDLQDLEGIREAIGFLSRTNSPERAGIVSAQVELLSLLHARARPLAHFVPVRNTLGALGEDGSLVLVISIDTVRFWSDVMTSLKVTVDAAREEGAEAIEIWSTGDIDQKSIDMAREMGVTVYSNILKYPVFRRAREGVDDAGAPASSQASADG